MALQRNVAQQVEVARSAIRRAVGVGASRPSWLRETLNAGGVDLLEGILVSYSELPEQGGILARGRWLTSTNQFWEFEALLESNQGRKLLELERFENITASLVVSEAVPGTGPSFAYLALQVLREQSGT